MVIYVTIFEKSLLYCICIVRKEGVMDFNDVLKKRRSIRKFKEQPVDRAVLLDLVEKASLAPSASNLQAWRFCIVDDPALVRKVDMFSPGLSGKPPVIIAICSDYGYAEQKTSGSNYKVYGCIMDASMAAENLMLAAVEAGLGTCAIKSYNDAAVRKLLQLPEHLHLEILISVGYPEMEPKMPKRKGTDEIVFFNTWEEKTDE